MPRVNSTRQPWGKSSASKFAKNVSFEQLVEPKLKAQGTAGDVFAVVGPYWTGFKWGAPSFKVAPGADTKSATATFCFDAQYGADQEHKEFAGTKTEKGKINHYMVVDGAGKTISWKQDYNVKHTMAVCEAVDASRQ